MTRLAKLAWLCAPLVLVAGCGGDQRELQSWMDQVRRDTRPITDVIPEPKQFEPFRYDNAGHTDPFSQTKLQPRSTGSRSVRRAACSPI